MTGFWGSQYFRTVMWLVEKCIEGQYIFHHLIVRQDEERKLDVPGFIWILSYQSAFNINFLLSTSDKIVRLKAFKRNKNTALKLDFLM